MQVHSWSFSWRILSLFSEWALLLLSPATLFIFLSTSFLLILNPTQPSSEGSQLSASQGSHLLLPQLQGLFCALNFWLSTSLLLFMAWGDCALCVCACTQNQWRHSYTQCTHTHNTGTPHSSHMHSTHTYPMYATHKHIYSTYIYTHWYTLYISLTHTILQNIRIPYWPHTCILHTHVLLHLTHCMCTCHT